MDSLTKSYLSAKKKKEEEKEAAAKKQVAASDSLTSSYLEAKQEAQQEKYKKYTGGNPLDDIAPILTMKTTYGSTRKDEDERKWFQKGAFEDGYQFGDVFKTILGTATDVVENVGAGVIGMGEKALDAIAYVSPLLTQGQYYQNGGVYHDAQTQKLFNESIEESKKWSADFIKKDLYDEEKIAKKIVLGTDEQSVLGEKSDALIQSGGQLLATAGLQAAGVPWFLTTGATSFGSQAETALNDEAGYEEAGLSATISAGAEILSEKLSGGIKFGGKTLDDVLLKPLTEKIASKTAKTLVNLGVDAVGEGLEEVFSGVVSNLGTAIYKEDDVSELLFSEQAMDEYLESFIGGAVLGGVGSGVQAIQDSKRIHLTENEQKVVEHEVEKRTEGQTLTEKEKNKIRNEVVRDMLRGYISTDTIEEVLGGETYQSWKNTVDSEDALQREYDELGQKQNATLAEQTRYNELHQQLKDLKTSSKRNALKDQLGNEVMGLVQNGRLAESYNERSRRGQAYQADISQYDEKQRATIQKAIDSGILNNTNRTHEFVDMIAKITADKGVLFDFTNNEKLKDSGFAVDGKAVNGYVTEDGVVLNIDSNKSMNSVVGHEITHVLEGTELYQTLQNTVFEYAKGKGDYQSRYDALAKLYEGVEGADINAELTADLVGDYLFTDTEFVRNLSVQHRNVFQKIYDEIKYLCKVATAGSKEARELEKVKKAFEEAYRAESKATDTKSEDFYDASTKYSLRVTDKDTLDFLDNQETVTTYKTMQLVDGKLYPPMASRIEGKFEDYSELGAWEQATEHPELIKNGNKFKLDKGKGQGSIEAAYNPYMHSSNLVLNDQFSGAYKRDNLVTVECEVPVSELTSGYHAEFAKDSVGWHPWHTGTVAGQLRNAKGTERQVLLSRWIKPVRIVPDAEVAAKYKELLDGTDVEVPDNVVTPALLQELKNAGVKIKESGRVKYSLSDSDGKQLSEEQREYFKDSKVRDENGSLKVMYHGTPNGDFTVFKDGTYFTDNKAYADRYQSPSASSINSGKSATNPKTFEVYLDIKKPFDISDAEARKIYINEYIKGGNAMGINPYLSDAEYDKIETIDWTEGEDLRDFLIDNEYDYDGLVLDEGADGGYGDKVSYRGKSYVVFSPEQVKNVDNQAPTSDPDIRFSLSEPVEESKNLVAVHNLTPEKLTKSLALGGLPMPSIAILKAQDGHGEFGDISLVFGRDTVDPKAYRTNKIYSGDAWTPTYPSIEYKPSDKVLKAVKNKISKLVPYEVQDALGNLMFDADNARDTLNRYDGNMAEAYKRDDAMKYAYLKDTGSDITLPAKEADLYAYGGISNDAVRYFSGKLTNGLQTVEHYQNMDARAMMQDEALKEAIADAMNWDVLRIFEPGSAKYTEYENDPVFRAEEVSFSDIDNMLAATRKLFTRGVQQTVDRKAAKDLIRDSVDQAAYENWLNDLFEGVVEKEGIRNNKDLFTSSGNRRSFEALHYEHNLENVIKAMREKGSKGLGGFGNGNIFGAATQEFSSIEQMKQSDDRLQHLSEEEFEAIKKDFSDRFFEIASSLPNDKKSFIATDDAANMLIEAVTKYSTKSGMANYLRKESQGWATYSDHVVDDLMELVGDIRSMPTGYFEAKPQRAVGFDEVEAVLVPDNLSEELSSELARWGFNVVTYEAGNDADRAAKLNELDDLKFSLSNVGEEANADSLSALKLEAAPVSNAKPNAEVVSNANSNAPIANESVGELFPDDAYAPMADDIAPVAETKQSAPMKAPTAVKAEAIRPKRQTTGPKLARATPAEQARMEQESQKVARVLTDEPKVDPKKPKAWNLFKDNVVDKGTVFETMSLKSGNRELQGKWKAIGRAEGSAQWFMEHGSGKTRSLKSIKDVVEKSGKTKKFSEYLYHMHNVDRMNLEDRFPDVLNKPVFGYGVTSDMSKVEAARLEKANPEFKRWAQDVYAYNKAQRQMLVDNGVISKETAELWEKMYPHYVPVRRVGDEGLNINVALDSNKTGVNAPVKRATGGNRDILPLFDTMAMRTEQTFKAIAKNRFGVELKNMLGTTIDTGEVSVDEMIDSVDMQDSLLQEGKDGNSPTFTVFENGERVTFEITEEMYDTMKPKGKLASYSNKVLNTANNIRRGLLTEYNPAFMLTNPIKDMQDVLMNSQHPARTYANVPKAIGELLGRNGQYYQEYMEHGGEQNTFFDGETKTFAKEKSGLSKAIGFPLEAISKVNNFIERVPRMAEYIASRKMGRSIDVSMLDAARVTTDFSAGGDAVKMLNRNGFTFLNASVQGAVQQVRNVREAKAEGMKGWAKLAAKTAVAGLSAELLNHLLWEDDEDYEDLSDYVKQNYYVVAKYDDGKFVRIPKGRTVAVIQDAFEQMRHLITGDDETDFGAFAELVISNLAPSNPLDNNLIAPIAQALRNETWYGDDLVPSRLQDLPAAEQYDETTDSISKWLGEKLNISPYKINYLLDQYSGGIGDTFLPMLTPEAERGNDSVWGDLIAPITDKFTTDSVLKNQNVTDFYSKRDELEVNANSRNATKEDELKKVFADAVSWEMSDLYAEKREIQNSDMSDSEKYEAVRELQKKIDALAESGLNGYEDVYSDGVYAEVGGHRFNYSEENGNWYEIKPKYSDGSDNWYYTQEQLFHDKLGVSYSDYWNGNFDPATDTVKTHYGEMNGKRYNYSEENNMWYEIKAKNEDGSDNWYYQMEQDVTKDLGISYEEYWDNREEYNFGYNHPQDYAIAKAVGGYDTYMPYYDALKNWQSDTYISSDKDENGDTIYNSRKKKVQAYIQELDIPEMDKLLLYKSVYNSYDDRNYEIIDYLNKSDLTFEETVDALRGLGFDVTDDGAISWK